MKVSILIIASVVISIYIVGCGKKSELEGAVIDGKGAPIIGITVVAKQVQPVKGYEQFETITDSNGRFKFKKIFPVSEYELAPITDKYIVEFSRIKIVSNQEGQINTELPKPFVLRYATPSPEVITDTKCGLMWARNGNLAGRPMCWDDAMQWVQNLRLAGYSDWRLPVNEELTELVQVAGQDKDKRWRDNLTKIGFQNVEAFNWDTKSSYYWSSDDINNTDAWCIFMDNGKFVAGYKKTPSYLWPVRTAM